MPKVEKIVEASKTCPPLRVTHRKGGEKKSPSMRIRCGCCYEAVVISQEREEFLQDNPHLDTLEINGVLGTLAQWRQVLAPLLGLNVPA